MKLSSRLNQLSLRAILMLSVVTGLHAGPALAAAPPAASTTLDVCHDEATGNWRYFGVVALAGQALDGSVVGIDYTIQNKTSALGYTDVLRAHAQAPIALADSGVKVTRFSIDAAALPLGTLRNVARVVVADALAPANAPLGVEAQSEPAGAVCGCPKPTGCVRTQGYWKSKPGVVWPAPYSRGATFFSSGLSWQIILETPPSRGNAYLILAHQYIAALLNRASGASAPAAVQSVINSATSFFSSGTNLDSCSGSACETQKTWAGILDTYNNGQYPGAPAPCPG